MEWKWFGSRPAYCGSVLIVEPDPKVARPIAGVFERAGWSATIAATGAESLTAASESWPDAVILEEGLSDADWVETLIHLRLLRPEMYTETIVLRMQYPQLSRYEAEADLNRSPTAEQLILTALEVQVEYGRKHFNPPAPLREVGFRVRQAVKPFITEPSAIEEQRATYSRLLEWRIQTRNERDPRMLLGPFLPGTIESEWERTIESALEMLRETTGVHYDVPRRPGIADKGQGIKLVFASSHTRLSSSTLLVMSPEHHRVLLPDISAADLLATAELLGMSSLEDLVALKCLCRQVYGVWERNCRPRHILTDRDVIECNLDSLWTYRCGHYHRVLTPDLLLYDTDGLSLWWLEWGGTVFTFELDRASHPPRADVKYLDWITPESKQLPYWRLR